MHSTSVAPPRAVVPGLLLASAGAIAFSGKAIIVKLAYRYGVDAVTVLMYRMLFALPLFLALSWWAGRNRPPLARRDWGMLFGLGFSGYYLASFLDFAGLQYISASLERLILYLNPTIVLLVGRLLFKNEVTRRQWFALGISYVGVLLVFGHDVTASGSHVAGTPCGPSLDPLGEKAPLSWSCDHREHYAQGSRPVPSQFIVLGAALVFGSALSYALYLVFSGEAVKRIGALRLTGLATSIASVLCIAQFFILKPASAMVVAPEVLWLSVLNATACTFCPVLLVMLAIERVGAGIAAQAGMIGPLSTIVLSVLLLDEPFNAWMAAGTALVVSGIWVLARRS